MEVNLIKYKRYFLYLFDLLQEKLMGLDFTLPAASVEVEASDKLNGYCKTSEKHLHTVLDALGRRVYRSNFLDIGCGKGSVLRTARDFPFRRVAGLELDPELVRIAKSNMRRLGMKSVEVLQGDALTFTQYSDFDVFFLFNPFTSEILQPVLSTILQSLEEKPREIRIIYHHPVYGQLLEDAGLYREAVLYDKLKGYETYIYCNR